MTKFKWGIMGPGRIAGKFARNLSVLPDAEIYAVASRSLDRAQQYGNEYGATNCYGSYEALLDDPGIDVIYIATPHVKHCENALMCLERGIPVLCEKPFAMNRGEVEQMIQMAKEKNVFLMEAMWTRFLPSILKAQEIIAAGKIGAVTGVKADFGFQGPTDVNHRLLNKALGGGSILDIGIYPIFLSLLVLGKPDSIQVASTLSATGVDVDTGILMKYGNEAIAQLHSCVISHTETEAFIYGEKGLIHIPRRWHASDKLEVRYYDGGKEIHEFDYKSTGLYFEAMEVMRCIRAGKTESDLMTHDLSLDLITLLDEIVTLAGIDYR